MIRFSGEKTRDSEWRELVWMNIRSGLASEWMGPREGLYDVQGGKAWEQDGASVRIDCRCEIGGLEGVVDLVRGIMGEVMGISRASM